MAAPFDISSLIYPDDKNGGIAKRRLNNYTPVSSSIVALVDMSTGVPYDIISGHFFTSFGAATTALSANGYAAKIANANSAYEDTNTSVNSPACSVFWVGRSIGTPTPDGSITILTHSNDSSVDPYPYNAVSIKYGSNPANLRIGFNNSGIYRYLEVAESLSQTSDDTLCGVVGDGTQILYKNGIAIVSASNAGDISYGTGPRLVIGEEYRFVSRNSATECNLLIVANRIWTVEEVKWVNENYKLLLTSDSSPIYYTATSTAVNLSGSSASAFSTTGTAIVSIPIVGATLSVAAVTGATSISESITGLAQAISTDVGGVSITDLISGVISGISTDTGLVSVSNDLIGSTQSKSNVSGNLLLDNAVAGNTYNISVDTGALTVTQSASGELLSNTTDTGLVEISQPISGGAQSISSVAGDLSSADSISGEVKNLTSTSGDLSSSKDISALSASMSVVSSTANISILISGELLSSALLLGNTTLTLPLSGIALSSALTQANISVEGQGNLSGSVKSQSSDSAQPSISVSLNGSAASLSNSESQLDTLSSVGGSGSSLSSIHASANTHTDITGSGNSSSLVIGSSNISIPISGNISAVANTSAGLGMTLNANGILASASLLTGDINISFNTTDLVGSIDSSSFLSSTVTITVPISGNLLVNAINTALLYAQPIYNSSSIPVKFIVELTTIHKEAFPLKLLEVFKVSLFRS